MPTPCWHSFTSEEVTTVRKALLTWYDANKRDLPWRRMASHPDVNKRAYAVWISEIMLQQTQVKSVIPYYERWMKKWPTIEALAKASLEEVNTLWSGLGYYSRARLIHEGAKKVLTEYNGAIPNSAGQLKSVIPGVGRYTAGAIASIAFNERVPVLDGNVIRVLTRLRCIGAPIQLATTNTFLWDLAGQLVEPDRPGDFNQAMMELGAIVCTPKQPNCSLCPLGTIGACSAYAQANMNTTRQIQSVQTKPSSSPPPTTDIEDCALCIPTDLYKSNLGVLNYPVKLSKRPQRKETTVVIVLHTKRNDCRCFLLFQRPKKGLLAGLWEFPSHKTDASSEKTGKPLELLKQGRLTVLELIRSALKPTQFDISDVHSIGQVVHLFSHIHMTYDIYTLNCSTLDEPSCGRWISVNDLEESAVSTATRKILAHFLSSQENLPNQKLDCKSKKRKSTESVIDAKQLRLTAFFQ